MDYAMPGKRKSKNDKKAKGRYNKYKRGGRFRATAVDEGKKEKE
jgi:hypothetical protein